VLVSNSEAVRTLRDLLNEEGVFAGVSAGAALAVARKTAARMDGGNVVVVFADGGSKYLSAGIYTKPEDELDREMEERVWW
jgi:cysteine synthase